MSQIKDLPTPNCERSLYYYKLSIKNTSQVFPPCLDVSSFQLWPRGQPKIAITDTNTIEKTVKECFEKLYSTVVKYQDNGSIAEYK